VHQITIGFEEILQIGKGRSVLYFIWDEPTYLVGKNTFIDSVLTKIGCINLCSLNRYPEFTELRNPNPDLVFLSSEPFPYTEQHLDKYQKLFPKAKVQLVDGEMCSWYGSRMLLAADYFKGFIL
jgi:ABC-type Fe3+-hydroxamate transport system substrate-binding protein